MIWSPQLVGGADASHDDRRRQRKLDAGEALAAFWAERRALARAARAGLDFTGAIRPPRASEEREWLLEQAQAMGPAAERENATTPDAPQGPRRRRV